jgi:hypothetical protein
VALESYLQSHRRLERRRQAFHQLSVMKGQIHIVEYPYDLLRHTSQKNPGASVMAEKSIREHKYR